jgi:hypothetical protein
MSEKPSPLRVEPSSTGERSSASLLVRCWLEPSGVAGEPPALRGYVKNLKTGEELFIKDLDAVGQEIQRHLTRDSAEVSDLLLSKPAERSARRSS